MPERGYALVTGASHGIGAVFARRLARDGRPLILVARSGDRLEALQRELPVDVCTVAADLSREEGVESVIQAARAVSAGIDLLVNNAGFGSGGDFASLGAENELAMIDLNVRALVALTHAFLEPMRERGRGAVVNVASTAAFQPVPYMATYAATKAFVLSFSQALHEENRRHGVHVMAVCPGTTATRFFESARLKPGLAQRGRMQTPEQVVEEAMHALARRKRVVVTGRANRWMTRVVPFVPRSLVLRVAARMMRNATQPR